MSETLSLPSYKPAQAPAAGLRLRTLFLHLAALAAWVGAYAVNGDVARFVAIHLLGLTSGTHLGAAVEFFVFELPEVLLLLTLIVFVVGIVRSFFTPEKTRRLLAGRRETAGNALASLLGVVTPFCSCSAVPMFIGFVTAGVPLGVTFSFLVAAPMVNEVALALLFGLFGWKVAGLYLGTGLLIAFASGWIIGRLKLESWVEPWVYQARGPIVGMAGERPGWERRLAIGREEVREIVGKVWLYVIAGIAVGAGIHGWVPENFMASWERESSSSGTSSTRSSESADPPLRGARGPASDLRRHTALQRARMSFAPAIRRTSARLRLIATGRKWRLPRCEPTAPPMTAAAARTRA